MVAARPPQAPSRQLRRLALAGLVASLVAQAAPARAAPPWNSRDDLICRAASAVGFSYYWGGSCWCASGCSRNTACGAGSCVGNCPSCTHSGSYGADCSGLVNKVWQVPDPIATTTCGHGPYVANSYKSDHAYWDIISRSSVQRGDVLASSTHIVVYHYGDPWGSMVTYEARGCAYGVVHNWRTCSSAYSAARRINISDCACTPGQTQTQACGNCGVRSRTCAASCQWGAWSACTGQGACSPGQSQTEACGFCGTRSRSCSSGCAWSAWSACQGAGTCAPGTTETQPCCDCGSQSRTCTGACAWTAWSSCAGPDPGGGAEACDTGQPGVCADGRRRCVEGCLACARVREPSEETCNDLDDDCDGAVDDGPPQAMSDPPPPFAARLLDHSAPRRLAPGEPASGWALFENVGSAPWPPGAVWLGALAPYSGTPSAFRDPETWLAHDVLALIPEEVLPGATAEVTFTLRASEALDRDVTETFVLLAPSGRPMTCPSPGITVTVGPRQRATSAEVGPSTPPGPGTEASPPEGSGGSAATNGWSCASALGGSTPPLPFLLVLALLLGWRHRRRR